MDAREMETLIQRLVQNPHDQEAITRAHQAGQSDPKAYASLLEKVGTATSDPAFASHWLTESANVWSTTLGDAHRAARALMIAIDRDPTQPTPAERLADLYRDKGDTKALVALLERRAKALTPLAQQDPDLRAQAAAIHEELGQLWQNPPLAQPKKAIENYKRAVELDPGSQYSVYALRELYKSASQWNEAIPYFELEQRIVEDPERKIALYQDESEVRKSAGDLAGAAAAIRSARAIEGGQDAALKAQLGSLVLERVQAGQRVPDAERNEAAAAFVELAEEYSGEHGFSYSNCALDLEATNDRAMQLAIYYGEQLGRAAEAAPRAAKYLKASPQGALAAEARRLVMEAGGDDSLLDALAPPPGADASEQVHALLELAQTYARKAKKNDAAAKFREVLALEPANLDAIGFLEPFLRQTRKFQDLRDILLTAGRNPEADEDKRKDWLREVAGLCETQLRDPDGAATALKELLALDAEDEAARGQLKRLLEKQARWDELAALLAEEAEQTVDVEARISLERALAKLHEGKRKDPVATGEAWARIAALASGEEEAISTAVRYFEKGARNDLAVQVIAENIEAISDDATRGGLLKKLAELREASGEMIAAGESFAEAAGLLKDAPLWESAERCFVSAEAWDQAATAIDERAQLSSSPKVKAQLFATEASYLSKIGEEPNAVLRLEQATELDPENESYAGDLEQRYVAGERNDDLAKFLLRRAEQLSDKSKRAAMRRRAAKLQRESLGDPEAARETLRALLEDGEDLEALATLAEDAQDRGEYKEAVELLGRLGKASTEPAQKVDALLREAALVADGLDDLKGSIEVYERVLSDFDPKRDDALAKIAELYERLDEPRGIAEALERRLKILSDNTEKLRVAERLADLYQEQLEEPKAAVKALDMVRELDPENFEAVGRLAELCEKLEDWPRVAELLAILIEVEGDEEEASRMTRRLAEILHEKVKKSDEALAALMQVADLGDEACREEYVKLGDTLGWKGVVATKLCEWYLEAPASPARNANLRGAFERFVEVGRDADAAGVAKELARTRGADAEIAHKLEEIAVKLKDLDALGIAHDLLVQELSGPARAEEMVRQAEVLASAGVEPLEAIQHGEQALTSVPPSDVEPLLGRLSKLAASPAAIIEIYERQITRCKAPADRLVALGRAASVAASHDVYDKARAFLDIALAGAVQEDTIVAMEEVARSTDSAQGGEKLRRTLAEALANGGQGSRDGGRTRGMLLGRAAQLAYKDLKDTDQAFVWLGDAIVAHVEDEPLDALEKLADQVGEPKRAETVLNRALEEVFDGPLVRKLLARRATLRRTKLLDAFGAAGDLKRLHDLSPSDTAVMDELSQLYTELEDFRGMVQLYEDQILRGKEPAARAELARKVARLWEEKLGDAREAADAWRRVLRMKAGDPEATEGLERAKGNMLKKAPSDPEAARAPSAPPSKTEAGTPSAEATSATAKDEPKKAEPSKDEPKKAEAPAAKSAEADSPKESALAEAASEPAKPEAKPETPAPAPAATKATPPPKKRPQDKAAQPPAEAAPAAAEAKPKEPEAPAASPAAEPTPAPAATAPAVVAPVTPAASTLADAPPPSDSAPRASVPPPLPTRGSAPRTSTPPPMPGSSAEHASVPPPPSSSGHVAAPPKPPPKKAGGPPPPPPSSSMRPPPPLPGRPAGSAKPPPPPPGGGGGGRPPPPPPAARNTGNRPPPPPGAKTNTAYAAPGAGNVSAVEAPGAQDDDDLSVDVDDDELIE